MDLVERFNYIADNAISEGILNQHEKKVLSRVGTRKWWCLKRHILDLSLYTLNKMQREGIKNKDIEDMCRQGIDVYYKRR